MKILLDTNVALDYLSAREHFFEASRNIVLIPPKLCRKFMSVKQMADVAYLIKRAGKSNNDVSSELIKFSRIVEVLDLTREDFLKAVHSKMKDFEDALLAYSAERYNIDYIITRNVNDFALSPINAISPLDFLSNISLDED